MLKPLFYNQTERRYTFVGKRELRRLLVKHAGNKAAVARALGVSRPTLYNLLRKHELEGGKP